MPPKIKCQAPEKYQPGESAKRFFARCETYFSILEYTDEKTKASQILMLLGNEAFDFAISLTQAKRESYTELKKELIKKFDGGQLPSEYARQFQHASLKAGEDLSAFMSRIDDLAKMAYPTFQEASLLPVVMNQFQMAMPSAVQKLYLLGTKAEDRASLVEKCKEYMQIENLGTNRGGACARVDLEEDRLDTVLKKVEALTVEVANIRTGNLTSRPGSETRGSRGPECFKCHKFGHIARYCRESSTRQAEVCEMCGNSGHSSRECGLNIRKGCHKCGNTGHAEKDCKFKGKALNFQ